MYATKVFCHVLVNLIHFGEQTHFLKYREKKNYHLCNFSKDISTLNRLGNFFSALDN